MTTKIGKNGLLLNISRLRSRTIFGLLLIFFLVLLLYGKYLNLYFSQDDFFHLKVSQTDGSFYKFLQGVLVYVYKIILETENMGLKRVKKTC